MKSRAPKTLTAVDPLAIVRLNNEAIVTDAIDKAIGTIRTAANAAKTAASNAETEAKNATGTRERIMLELAKLANDGGWTDAMIDSGLDHAFNLHYADYKLEDGKFPTVGTVAVIRSELKRATNPKIRAQLPAIFSNWIAALDADIAASDADDKAKTPKANRAPTPVKDRFHARHQMLTQAMTLAIGKAADKKGNGGEASYVPGDVAAVHSWVRAHPRSKGGVKTPETVPTANDDGTPLTPRQIATAEVEQVAERVRELAKKYGHADCFTLVLDALSKCTGVKLVPNASAPTPVQGAPTPVVPSAPPAEPVPGAAELDDAVGGNDAVMLQQFQAFQAFQAMMKANGGK